MSIHFFLNFITFHLLIINKNLGLCQNLFFIMGFWWIVELLTVIRAFFFFYDVWLLIICENVDEVWIFNLLFLFKWIKVWKFNFGFIICCWFKGFNLTHCSKYDLWTLQLKLSVIVWVYVTLFLGFLHSKKCQILNFSTFGQEFQF